MHILLRRIRIHILLNSISKVNSKIFKHKCLKNMQNKILNKSSNNLKKRKLLASGFPKCVLWLFLFLQSQIWLRYEKLDWDMKKLDWDMKKLNWDIKKLGWDIKKLGWDMKKLDWDEIWRNLVEIWKNLIEIWRNFIEIWRNLVEILRNLIKIWRN